MTETVKRDLALYPDNFGCPTGFEPARLFNLEKPATEQVCQRPSFVVPQWPATVQCAPTTVHCEPRNAIESAVEMLSWQSRQMLESTMANLALLIMFAILYFVLIRNFHNNKSAAYIMGLSGFSAASFSLASIDRPQIYQPCLFGLGAFFATGALIALAKLTRT